MKIKSQKDFFSGLLFMAAGIAFAWGATNYTIGEAARMGPGYFPLAVGVLLAIVGFITAAQGLRVKAQVETIKKPNLAVMAWILGAVVLFGLLLNTAGLVLSLVVLVLVSSRASHEFTWRGTLINAVVLVAFSVGAFIKGINLQIPLWPTFLR